jgi:hypothetical protein
MGGLAIWIQISLTVGSEKLRENVTNTMEAVKDELKMEKATEGLMSNGKSNKHSKFWKSEGCELRSHKLLALLIIFELVLLAMWSELTAIMICNCPEDGWLPEQQEREHQTQQRRGQTW